MAVVTEWRDRQRRGRAKSEFTLEAEADVAGGLVGWQPFDGADGEEDAAAAFAGVYYHYYTLQAERADLLFGWKVLKHVRSNGILFAKGGQTVGVGSGQCSRIDSVEAAIRKAARSGHDLRGAVLVSDAFFPFRDCVDRAHEAGVTAVLQPGGSVRDEESVRACDEHGMAMAVNHARVFSHG